MSNSADLSVFAMVTSAGPMVKLVLLILLLLSIVSLAIIIYKYKIIKKCEKETVLFYEVFWSKKRFDEVYQASKNYSLSPLSRIFKAFCQEVLSDKKDHVLTSEWPMAKEEDLKIIMHTLKNKASSESASLESLLPFLATTGNAAPFIGLFGTVWGIMNTFTSIGAKGSASLAVVAPGIAEALIATAMGLFAAIPAVIGYNFFITRTDRMITEMDNFITDINVLLEKQINIDKNL